jgi:hypothetical protein
LGELRELRAAAGLRPGCGLLRAGYRYTGCGLRAAARGLRAAATGAGSWVGARSTGTGPVAIDPK